MAKTPLPRATAPVRMALTLVTVLILYRLALISGAFQDLIAAATDAGTNLRRGEDLAQATNLLGSSDWPRIPGGFGSPVLLFLLLPLMIAARQMMRRGYGIAANIFLGFLGLRALMIVVRGPWNGHSAALMLIMLSIAALLSLPTSSEWFRECARLRESRTVPLRR